MKFFGKKKDSPNAAGSNPMPGSDDVVTPSGSDSPSSGMGQPGQTTPDSGPTDPNPMSPPMASPTDGGLGSSMPQADDKPASPPPPPPEPEPAKAPNADISPETAEDTGGLIAKPDEDSQDTLADSMGQDKPSSDQPDIPVASPPDESQETPGDGSEPEVSKPDDDEDKDSEQSGPAL